MGTTNPRPVVFDAGALIAFEKGNAKLRALCREALRTGARIIVPAGVVAQVWRQGAQQVVLRALLNGPTTEVPPLDRVLAEATGILCGKSGTSDVVDAAVVLVARGNRAVVVTSDPHDLRRLDPSLAIEVI